MATEDAKMRQIMSASMAQNRELTKAVAALNESVVAFHREWRLFLKTQRGECTCPWNQNPLEPSRGHNRVCPSLKEVHTADDKCFELDPTKGHSDEVVLAYKEIINEQ